MSTHVPGFQSISGVLHYFVLAKLANSSIHKDEYELNLVLAFYDTFENDTGKLHKLTTYLRERHHH